MSPKKGKTAILSTSNEEGENDLYVFVREIIKEQAEESKKCLEAALYKNLWTSIVFSTMSINS